MFTVISLEELEQKNQDKEDRDDKDPADDVSNDDVGLEEVAILDSNIDDNTYADADVYDRADDGSEVDDSGGVVIAPPPLPSTPAATPIATTQHPDPIIPGGKFTTMLQQILSLGVNCCGNETCGHSSSRN